MTRSATTGDLARVCKGMANPIRCRILQLLRARYCSVNELVDELAIEQSKVSKHLSVLANAGLVHAEVQGRQHCYRLTEPRRIGRVLDSLGALCQIHDTRSKP